MYPYMFIIVIALVSLKSRPEVCAQLHGDQKTEGWSQLDLTTSSKGLSNHNSDVSNYIQSSDSSTTSPSTRSSAGTSLMMDNELPMGYLGSDSQQLFPFDFNAMKQYAEPLLNVLNQTFPSEPTASLYQPSNNAMEHLNANQLDPTDLRNSLRLNMPTNVQLDNFRKRALKSMPQMNLKNADYPPTGPLSWLPLDASKKIKYHTPLNPFEQLIAANMMAAGNPLLKSLLVKHKRAVEPEFLMSPSNQVTRVLPNNYNLPLASNPVNFFNTELEQPRALPSLKREFPTIYIESPAPNKASRFAEEEAMSAYMDQLYTSTKMSSPFYASYPYSYMGAPKYYPATRKVFDKSLITSALVGIGAGSGNNMIINPNNNIQPNNNNQQTTTARPPNQGRKRRSSNYLDELEQKVVGIMKSFAH